jgi:hypothetical protein
VSSYCSVTTVALSDARLEFPLQLVGTSRTPQPLTLTNSGPVTLIIASITSSPRFPSGKQFRPKRNQFAALTVYRRTRR